MGDGEFTSTFIVSKVGEWIEEIKSLSKIVCMHPHAAYCAFTNSIQHKYTYIMRTVPELGEYFAPLEEAIRKSLLPALFNGYICNDQE